MNPLPTACIGIRLRYKQGVEMNIINQSETHILCQFDNRDKIAFKRDKFTTSDIVSYPKEVISNEPKLF